MVGFSKEMRGSNKGRLLEILKLNLEESSFEQYDGFKLKFPFNYNLASVLRIKASDAVKTITVLAC